MKIPSPIRRWFRKRMAITWSRADIRPALMPKEKRMIYIMAKGGAIRKVL